MICEADCHLMPLYIVLERSRCCRVWGVDAIRWNFHWVDSRHARQGRQARHWATLVLPYTRILGEVWVGWLMMSV